MRRAGGGLLRSVELLRDQVPDFDAYPFDIPAVRGLRRLDLDPGVTFLAGENASGKSTLLEAMAVAAGFNPEGGSRNFAFSTRRSESDLHRYLRVRKDPKGWRTGFFLRAESFFNVATQVEDLGLHNPTSGLPYGHTPLHEQSHGQSFLALANNRFGGGGLYLLDEPEAALSFRGCLALLGIIHQLVREGSQFVIATHSPVLLGYPHARIYSLTDEGIERARWEDTDPYRLTLDFLTDRDRFFRHLLAADG